ncbi:MULTISPECIES: hypothetical protein [Nocardia]|uniref:hypothetical protein n=1 Tax=Nocardia TaxID=1817 RepID=UPI002458252C|nr:MULTISPECIES: hypothetical protein [Nocardia]
MTTTSTADLRRWLDAAATLAGNDLHATAIALLDFAGLLDRTDVRDLIEAKTVIGRDDQPVRGAWIDWAALARAVDTDAIGPLGSGADRLLRLAVSIAHGRPVDLRGTLPGLGHAHARAVVTAVVRACGLADDVEINDTPAYLARRRAHDAALAEMPGEDGA